MASTIFGLHFADLLTAIISMTITITIISSTIIFTEGVLFARKFAILNTLLILFDLIYTIIFKKYLNVFNNPQKLCFLKFELTEKTNKIQ